MKYATGYHAPVLCKAVVDGLITDGNGIYVDATLGGGGHTAAMLEALSAKGRVVGIDRDEDACAEARSRLAPEIRTGRLRIVRGDFADMTPLVHGIGVEWVDGVLVDLGVSSHQLDDPGRGFSYMKKGNLDMRMNPGSGITAADVVNNESESEIKLILRVFGEEPKAGRVARAIVNARPMKTTTELAAAVRSCVPHREEVKTLSRVFQALRIKVNREIEALESVLESATTLIRQGGRLVVISYHSLEDRRVKRFQRFGNLAGQPVKDVYGNVLSPWRPITRRPIQPGDDEIEVNPRSRSARLRIAERTGVTTGIPGAHH